VPRCPRGHALVAGRASRETLTCDGPCGCSLPPSALRYCCEPCDFDVCPDCAELTRGAEGAAGAERPPPAAAGAASGLAGAASGLAAGAAAGAALSLERLAQEMRCSLCLDTFDDPHSLPCQHSFCKECIFDALRLTSTMACPLCKAPAWKRQVAPNHTLAGICAAFRQMAEQG